MSGKIEKIYKAGKNIWAVLFGMLSIFLTFISWGDIGIKDVCTKIIILLAFVGSVALLSIVIMFFYENGNNMGTWSSKALCEIWKHTFYREKEIEI